MPRPTAAHLRLHGLAGTWVGEETLSPSPWGPGGKATGRSVMRVDLDGFWVVQDYVEEKDGQIVFRGHGVFGIDAPTGEVCWYWVDSMGFVPAGPSRGTWDGDTLRLASSSPMGKGRYTYAFEGADTYRFSIENSFDDGATWKTFMTAVYRRT